MDKDIKYNGLSAVPSDYNAPDGDLDVCHNLINEDQAIKPLLPPADICQLPIGYNVVFIHKTADYTHYIVNFSIGTYANQLAWFDHSVIADADSLPVEITPIGEFVPAGNPLHRIASFSDKTIYGYNTMGNTFMVLTDDGIYYFLFKDNDNNPFYNHLGNHLPELNLSFGLQGHAHNSVPYQSPSSRTLYFNSIPSPGSTSEFKTDTLTQEEWLEELNDNVLGNVNRVIADKSTNSGRFFYPFLVRYAYRLFDGSLTMHSGPVLMVTTSSGCPRVFVTKVRRDGQEQALIIQYKIGGLFCDLDYVCLDGSASNLDGWKDIIKSVDIFISAPIYTYNQSKRLTGWSNINDPDMGYSVCRFPTEDDSYADLMTYDNYVKWSLNPIICKDYNTIVDVSPTDHPEWYKIGKLQIDLPQFSQDSVNETIRNTSNFYFLKSIKLDDIATTRTIINIPEDYLQSLTSREVMSDDYDSRDTIIPKYSFNYNSRLNLANIIKQLAKPMPHISSVCFCDFYITPPPIPTPYPFYGNTTTYDTYIHINQDGKEIVVKTSSDSPLHYHTPLLYLYYPNVCAHKATIVVKRTLNGSPIQKVYEIPLQNHDFLNGAVFFKDWNGASEALYPEIPEESDNRSVNLPNKIYSSEVNNPFLFPASGINTVGTGSIVGIATTTQALSEGQFGQFPLYVFATDGIWSMEVTAIATFATRQPITRDICIYPDSITNLDNSIIFVSQRGIMLLSGSKTTCLSDGILSELPFNIESLPYCDQILSAAVPSLSRQFLSKCRFVYDYERQRVTAFNASYRYAFVFSLKSRLWGSVESWLASTVNSYPDALAMTIDNRFVALSSFVDNQPVTAAKQGSIVTRPLKLDAPDILKSVRTVLQRGYFQLGDIKSVLYGSRDLFNWHLIASSSTHKIRNVRGTSYKYFRIVLVTDLHDNKSLSSATVNFEPRHTNVLH